MFGMGLSGMMLGMGPSGMGPSGTSGDPFLGLPSISIAPKTIIKTFDFFNFNNLEPDHTTGWLTK